MSDPLTRIRALMALALGSSTPVEEARTAAMAAVRLIEAHRLLGAAAVPPRSSPRPEPARTPPPGSVNCSCVASYYGRPGMGGAYAGHIRNAQCPIHGDRAEQRTNGPEARSGRSPFDEVFTDPEWLEKRR